MFRLGLYYPFSLPSHRWLQFIVWFSSYHAFSPKNFSPEKLRNNVEFSLSFPLDPETQFFTWNRVGVEGQVRGDDPWFLSDFARTTRWNPISHCFFFFLQFFFGTPSLPCSLRQWSSDAVNLSTGGGLIFYDFERVLRKGNEGRELFTN